MLSEIRSAGELGKILAKAQNNPNDLHASEQLANQNS
jgi:hypothetical protein